MSQAPIIRITHDGAERVTGGGEVRITGFHDVPEFDVDSVIHAHFPGLVVQANLVEAVTIWLLEHGTVSDADEASILALANVLLTTKPRAPVLPTTQNDYAPVPYPSGMLRIPNSNPTPRGWSIVDDGTVVRGLEP
jgi:hypothetical protein